MFMKIFHFKTAQLNNKMFLQESIVDSRYEFLLNESQNVTTKKEILFHI